MVKIDLMDNICQSTTIIFMNFTMSPNIAGTHVNAFTVIGKIIKKLIIHNRLMQSEKGNYCMNSILRVIPNIAAT